MSTRHAIVVDLGSSSGRVVIASLAGEEFTTTEVYRFPHHAREVNGTLVWEIDQLVDGVITGLQAANSHLDGAAATVAIDTWGVDYVCLDANGDRVGPVVCYRDARTQRTASQVPLSAERHFALTGVQPEAITTARQLFAQVTEDPHAFDDVASILLLPDYVGYRLTGVQAWSPTILSTSALAVPGGTAWAEEVFEALKIPRRLVGEPGAVSAPLTVPGLEHFTLVSGGSHDTACAVHGLGLTEGEAFLSCGSWSLVGCVLDAPFVTDSVFELGFTNEVCTDGKIRMLQNLTGLWILQQCCRIFEQQGKTSDIATLVAQAAECPDPGVRIDTTEPVFAVPGDYPAIVSEMLVEAGVEKHDDPALIVRVVTESLAMTHVEALRNLEKAVGISMSRVRMIGGGVRNELLCQLTANWCGIPVIAGPQEGTALGSAIAQFEAQGVARQEVLAAAAKSIQTVVYQPQ
ncbi:MAG: FGGY-family carbohydrate kinase [Corynebacterium sp.]|nr:FGGY-family carbohydrate kinase [Corynebacterium sp.]